MAFFQPTGVLLFAPLGMPVRKRGNAGDVSEDPVKKEEELIVKTTKEVVVKFIEIGRLSPGSFEEVWHQVLKTVRASIRSGDQDET